LRVHKFNHPDEDASKEEADTLKSGFNWAEEVEREEQEEQVPVAGSGQGKENKLDYPDPE